MKISVQSEFRVPAETFWMKLQKPANLAFISAPLVRFEPTAPFDWQSHWQIGRDYSFQLTILGQRQAGTYTVRFTQIDSKNYQYQTEESGGRIRSYTHHAQLTETSRGTTLYRDTVTLDAGWATVPFWVGTQLLYRHRHRRWKRVLEETLID